MTLLISGRLLSQKRRIAKTLGNRHARQYTSVVAMMVESALLDSAFAVPYLVLYGINHPAQLLLLQVLLQAEASCTSVDLVVREITN